MRNKLKLSKKCKDVAFPREDQTQDAEAIKSSRSTVETSPEDGSALTTSTVKPNTGWAKDTKIAPIFLRATQHGKSKKTSDGDVDLHVDKCEIPVLRSESNNAQHVKSQLSSAPVLRPSQRVGLNPSTCSGQRSPSALRSCLEEIQTSNPTFPLRTVFSTLRDKTSQSLQSFSSTARGPSYISSLQSPRNHFKEKRKREHESFENVSKRLKSSITAESVSTGHRPTSPEGVQESPVLSVKKQPRSSRLSRTHRLKRGSGRVHLVDNCGSNSEWMSHRKSDRQPPIASDAFQRESSCEEVLWTDKYSPQHSTEVIGNSAAVDKLHRWLKKWKLRADCDERRKFEEKQHEENSNDSWDCGDFEDEAGTEDSREEPLCNTMLITGPPGVGKTASVYACALELGFKVFEVNCSSQRSGRQVLSQLKEATQSHLVETSGKDPLKPTFFNNYNASSCPAKSDRLPARNVAQRNVISTSKKRPAQTFTRSSRRGKANPATATLTSYFKMKTKADRLHFGGPSPSEKPDSKTFNEPSPDSDQTVPQNKKTATSLILFEEVDVIFDDDVGFLEAIKTFMATTKRPVILTTNDPLFRERFNCSLEDIVFKTPSVVDVCSYLQLVCLAENVKLDLDDVSSLVRLTRGDVRHCLIQLQLWAHSGGGLPKDPSDSSGYKGCTANMLGLQSVAQNYLLHLLNHQFWTEAQMNKLLKLLVESWRRGVPLLYCNLELLLPTGESPVLDKATCSGPHSELAAPDIHTDTPHLAGNVSQQPTLHGSNSVKNISRLSRRKYVATTFNGAQNTHRNSVSLNGTHKRAQSSDKTEQRADRAVTSCLGALADFFDLMSDLDATLPAARPLVSGSCQPEEFLWTGAEIQDGLLDEMLEEEGRRCSQERLLDMQAAVEGLGFHRCWWQVSEVWTEAQRSRRDTKNLTYPASSNKQSLSFTFQPLCTPSVSKKRYKLNRTVLSSRPFNLLGNRRAVGVDYMPVLRFICRSNKEQKRQQEEEPDWCLNYLSRLHLGLSKSTIRLLAEDVSSR